MFLIKARSSKLYVYNGNDFIDTSTHSRFQKLLFDISISKMCNYSHVKFAVIRFEIHRDRRVSVVDFLRMM